MAFKVFSVLLSLVICFSAYAQPGIKDSIYSKIIGEERRLQIQVPDDYKPGSGQKYTVLYLLDGEWNAELFQQTQRWAKQWEFTMPIIMVGVVNSYPKGENQRFRDLTPTSGGNNGAGGGPKLLAFLKDELIPYIDKTYPTNGSNILWGHSLGGLFVLYALFTEPQLFDSYIAADPSCWWDHAWLKGYAKQRMKNISGVKSLYITGRSGDAYHGMGIDSMLMVLKESAPANLLWADIAYPNETHVSQQGKSAYDGLKYTLTPLMLGKIHINPSGGIVERGKPFVFSCEDWFAEKNIRYSVDGTEPTLASSKMKDQNTISPVADVRLKMRAFFAHDTADKKDSAIFKIGEAWPAGKKPAKAIAGGWSYAAYTDAGDTVPIKLGITNDRFDQNNVDTGEFFCRLSGFLETTKKGYYTFLMGGAPGTKLFLNDRLLMEVPAGAGGYSFLIPLEKGFYSIRFEYSRRKDGPRFNFGYRTPDSPEDRDFLPTVMYH
jgi:predicted alpha/beta superfamily hydrolase